MKVQEIINEFMPCEVCGNKDINHFYLHVFSQHGSLPYVKCCECEEEFYSETANEIISKAKSSRQARQERIAPVPEKEIKEFYIGLSGNRKENNIGKTAWSV